MTNTERLIHDVQEALAKATPGPWDIDPTETSIHKAPTSRSGARSSVYVAQTRRISGDADAHLIAHAPEWLAALVAALQQAQQERREVFRAGFDASADRKAPLGWSFEPGMASDKEPSAWAAFAALTPTAGAPVMTLQPLPALVETLERLAQEAKKTEARLHEIQRVSCYPDAILRLCQAWREAQTQLADCLRLTGADPNGDEDWRLAREAVAAVGLMRDERDHAEARADALQRELDALHGES